MLVAYLDEFGHIGPFVSNDHPEHKTHPAFGYAGFVIPVENVREFGGFFEFTKQNLLSFEIKRAGAHPRRWEKKGSSLLTARNFHQHGSKIIPAIDRLTKRLAHLGGEIVFYGAEKERGDDVNETSESRSTHMLINSVRQLAAIADAQDRDIMIFLDSVDETPRLNAVSQLGGFIYSNTDEKLKRVVEVPMQLESKHYGNVQFADWICGLLGRVSKFHLSNDEEFDWAPNLYASIVHRKKVCNDNSYIRTERESKSKEGQRVHLHSRHLSNTVSWCTTEQPRATKPKKPRSRRSDRGPSKIVNNVGASSPALASFYETLKQQ